MDVIVAADDVVNPKPHPEPLLRAAEALGVDPARGWYVGDSVHDMACGRRAGMRTAAALWGPFRREQLAPAAPDHWLDHPGQLAALLEVD
jgi:phosphoglycolate phosphatase-like HAD superfamily hydrolase